MNYHRSPYSSYSFGKPFCPRDPLKGLTPPAAANFFASDTKVYNLQGKLLRIEPSTLRK